MMLAKFQYSVFVLIVISIFFLTSCQTTQPITKEEPNKNLTTYYPPKISFSEGRFAELKKEFDSFITAYQAKYQYVQFDSLLTTVKLLQAGAAYANIFSNNPDRSKRYSEEQIMEAIAPFFDRWSSLFNLSGSDIAVTEQIESDNYIDVTLQKKYPEKYPFVNGEYNSIRLIISKNGDIGFLQNNCLPSLPISDLSWIDPEIGRQKLFEHKISYTKNNKTNLFIVTNLATVSAGTKTSIALVRRRPESNDLKLDYRNVQIEYHLAWMYAITPTQYTVPLFRVYVDAADGEILESYYLGNP